MTRKCIVCGNNEDEVQKLFCFPKNPDRCHLWQERLGYLIRENVARSHRICSNHFSSDSFVPCKNVLTLKVDAVPMPFIRQNTVNIDAKRPQLESATPPPTQSSAACADLEKDLYSPLNIDALLPPVEPATPPPTQSSAACADLEQNVCTPHVRRSLFKSIQGLCSADLTPRKTQLMSMVRSKEDHIRKLKKVCKARFRQKKGLGDIGTFIQNKNIFKGMSQTTSNFIISQIRCSKRSPYGRRWTLDDKIMALAIYKRGPKCYRLLRRLLAFPSIRTLNTLLENVTFNVGINQHIFKHLGECLNEFPESERVCTLTFDEMAIREHVQYNSYTDCIEGLEDFGTERTNRNANYVLVFMIQGIVRSWKQPIAFYFSRGGINSARMQGILRDILTALSANGIPVLATVCDMGTSNVKTLNDMGSTQTHPYFEHEGNRISTIFDVPHLLKCTRNLFKKYNVQIPACEILPSVDAHDFQARWSDIVAVYERDKNSPMIFRSLYKIKDFYFAPLRQNSMKVKIAAQTLSRSTGICLYNAVTNGMLPPRALATAKFVSDIDNIFDSCNGTVLTPPECKPYKCRVTKESGHEKFWSETIDIIKQWRFLRNPRHADGPNFWKPPSQKGWLYTLQAFIDVSKKLKSMKVEAFKPRYLNQDALENLFGLIRSGCGCNENPTMSQFIGSFKTQVINGLTKQGMKNANCEEDELQILSNLKSFLQCDDKKSDNLYTSPSTSGINTISQEVDIDVGGMVATGTSESFSVAYVTGSILKRLFDKLSCPTCSNILTSDDLEPFNQFIAAKEFSNEKRLYYPAEQVVVAVGRCITMLEVRLEQSRNEMELSSILIKYLEESVDFDFLNECVEHSHFVRACILYSVCRIGLPWFCNRMCRDIKKEAHERKLKKLTHI